MIAKPDDDVSRSQLRAYILSDRDDGEAIGVLIRRGDTNASNYRFPQTDEDLREMEEILKQKLSSNGEAVQSTKASIVRAMAQPGLRCIEF